VDGRVVKESTNAFYSIFQERAIKTQRRAVNTQLH
jgi:hypothetical protein